MTITIFIVLVSAGLPSMTAWINSNQMKSSASSLTTLLRAARSEALTRNNTVTLASNAGGGDWTSNIRMYMDTAGGNSPFDASEGDEAISTADLRTSTVTINGSAAATTYISFSGDGRLDEGGATVSIEVCRGRGANVDTTDGQTIDINIVGRVSVSDGVTDCTP